MHWYCISEVAGIGVPGVPNHQGVVCVGIFLLQQSGSTMQAIACNIDHSTHTPVWTALLAISSEVLSPNMLALSGCGVFYPGVYVPEGPERDALTAALAKECYVPVYLDPKIVRIPPQPAFRKRA